MLRKVTGEVLHKCSRRLHPLRWGNVYPKHQRFECVCCKRLAVSTLLASACFSGISNAARMNVHQPEGCSSGRVPSQTPLDGTSFLVLADAWMLPGVCAPEQSHVVMGMKVSIKWQAGSHEWQCCMPVARFQSHCRRWKTSLRRD